MTVDETWVHYYEPENKAQWVGPGSSRKKKVLNFFIFSYLLAFIISCSADLSMKIVLLPRSLD